MSSPEIYDGPIPTIYEECPSSSIIAKNIIRQLARLGTETFRGHRNSDREGITPADPPEVINALTANPETTTLAWVEDHEQRFGFAFQLLNRRLPPLSHEDYSFFTAFYKIDLLHSEVAEIPKATEIRTGGNFNEELESIQATYDSFELPYIAAMLSKYYEAIKKDWASPPPVNPQIKFALILASQGIPSEAHVPPVDPVEEFRATFPNAA